MRCGVLVAWEVRREAARRKAAIRAPGDIDGSQCGDEQRRARQQLAVLQSALGDSGLRREIGGTTPSCADNATRRNRRRGWCSEARLAMVGDAQRSTAMEGDAQRSTATWPWSGVVRVAQRCATSGSARHSEARSATFATQRRTAAVHGRHSESSATIRVQWQ